MITDINQLDFNNRYTYTDYLTWQFKERVELLWGKIIKLSAAPSTQHQKVLGEFHLAIRNAIGKNKCQVFIAPFDVRLPIREVAGDEVENVVQPDLSIVCDAHKVDEKGCLGAPDLIVEVLSPSSSSRDSKAKLKLYEQACVPEYWVVDPHDGLVYVYVLDSNDQYKAHYPVTVEDTLESTCIPGLSIQMGDVFPDILNEPEEAYGDRVRRWD